MEYLEKGEIDPDIKATCELQLGAYERWNGHRGFGPPVCRRPQAAKPVLRRGSCRSTFPRRGKAVMAYPPTGSVQTECTRLPVMLRTKGRFLCQRTIGFVGLQKHINSGYAFTERQTAHNGKRGKGYTLPAWA